MDKWLNHPTAIKLIALAVGIMMWAVVHFEPPGTAPGNVGSTVETKTIDGVKVTPFGLDERNFVLNGLDPQTVTVTVRGNRSDLQLLAGRKEDYRLQVDLRSVNEGKRTVPIQIDLPRGIQLVYMSPGSVSVTVEALQTKEFEADIQTRGTPADGYIAGTPIVKPTNRVHVTLPRNKLAQVSRVGAVLPVDGKTQAIKNKSVKLAAYDAEGRVLEGALLDPAVVEVEVPVTTPFKTVPLQFRMIGQMPAGLSIATFKPDVEQVTVYGPKDALDTIDSVEADVVLDGLTKSGKVTIPLIMPSAITQIAPIQAVVDIEVVLSDSRTLAGLPIHWKGLGAGLSVKITDPATGKADIVVKGAPALLGRLQPGDIQVIADLSGKGPGTHTVQLTLNSPRFIEQSGGTSAVTVEIAADVPASATAGPSASASPSGG